MISFILFVIIAAVIISNPVKTLIILAVLAGIGIAAEVYIKARVQAGAHEYTVRHHVWLVIKWTGIAILIIIFFVRR